MWGFVSSVAVALSVSSVVAFRSSLPASHHRQQQQRRAGAATASQVVTDPNNVINVVERRRSAADRAALEELYMLSVAAEAQMAAAAAVASPKRKAKIKRKPASPRRAAAAAATTTTATRTQKQRPLGGSYSSSALRATASTDADSGESDARSSSPQQSQPLALEPQSRTVTPQFHGLTTKPNRRNRHEKSLTSLSPVLRNPTLRRGLSGGGGGAGELLVEGESRPALRYKDPAKTGSPSASSLTPATAATKNAVQNTKSRSSTMPGYNDRKNTLRQKKFRDGIKLAEQLSGKEFVETEEERQSRRRASGEYMYKTSASVPDSLVNFAVELHGIDRITPSEEVELGEKTQEAIKLQKIYDGLVAKLDREPTDDEWCAAAGKINMEAIVQAIDEGLQAKNTLVTSNLRMVQGVVNVYIRNGLQGHYNAGDLMQEGIMVSKSG